MEMSMMWDEGYKIAIDKGYSEEGSIHYAEMYVSRFLERFLKSFTERHTKLLTEEYGTYNDEISAKVDDAIVEIFTTFIKYDILSLYDVYFGGVPERIREVIADLKSSHFDWP